MTADPIRQHDDGKTVDRMIEAAFSASSAYHESGHAVSAYLLGENFASVSIRRDNSRNSSGRVIFTKRPKLTRDSAAIAGVIAISGYAAKMRFLTIRQEALLTRFGEPAHFVCDIAAEVAASCEGDFEHAVELANAFEGGISEVARYLAMAEFIVRAAWPAVVALAEELLRRPYKKSIQHIEAVQIIDGYLPESASRIANAFRRFPQRTDLIAISRCHRQ